MSAPSDDELNSIIDLLKEQQKIIEKAYHDEYGFVCNKKVIDIHEANENSAEREKTLKDDIQSLEGGPVIRTHS